MPGLPQGWARQHRAPGAAGGAPAGAGQSPVSPRHTGPLCPLRTPPRKGFHTRSLLERRGEGASPAAVPPKTRLTGGAEGRKITAIGEKGNFQVLGLGFFVFSSWHRCEQPLRTVQTLRVLVFLCWEGLRAHSTAARGCRSPSCKVFTPGGGPGAQVGAFSPFVGQIQPKLGPRCHRSARA